MSKGVFRKRLGRLVPVDDEARAVLNALKEERDVMVSVHAPRSIDQHRLFFGLLNILVDNTDDVFVSVEDARKRLLIAAGEVDIFINPDDGKTYLTPRSMKFESMDQVAFASLFDRALNIITSRWLIGTEDADLRQAIYDVLDSPTKKKSKPARRALIGVSPDDLEREGKAA